jgi:hypothetical protein
MAPADGRSSSMSNGEPSPSKAVQHAFGNQRHDHSWRSCITEKEANRVVLGICLELVRSNHPKSWVLKT